MIKNKTLIQFIFFILVLSGIITKCHRNESTGNDNALTILKEKKIKLRIDNPTETKPSSNFTDYFSLITQFKIQPDSTNPQISGLSKVLYDKQAGLIFILDRYLPGIFVFKDSGHFQNGIGQIGNGPAEYITPEDICLLPNHRIAIAAGTLDKIIIFHYNGVFEKTYPLFIHTGKGKNPISPELLCYIRGNFFIGTHPNVGGQYFIQKFSSRGNYLTGFHPLTFRLRWAPEVTKFPKVDGVTKNLLYFADRIQPKIYIYEIDGTLSNEYWMKPLHTAHIQLVHELDKRLKHRSSSRGIRIQDIFSKLMYKTDHFEFVQVHSQYIYVEMVYRYLLFNRKGKCLFDLDLEPYKTGPQSVKYPNTSKFRFITGGETAGGWSNGLIRCGFLPHKPSEPPSGIIQVSIYKYRPSDDSAS